MQCLDELKTNISFIFSSRQVNETDASAGFVQLYIEAPDTLSFWFLLLDPVFIFLAVVSLVAFTG